MIKRKPKVGILGLMQDTANTILRTSDKPFEVVTGDWNREIILNCAAWNQNPEN